MSWYDSYKFKPKHGTQIFIWDRKSQAKIFLNAFWDKWTPNPNFPCWKYVFDGLTPDKTEKD